ncbi:MAG: MinD/ParA family protein, partial [Phycisphaerae bacterium]|nr:MinD/ParA family protein [Phycisphaerae bacterium]
MIVDQAEKLRLMVRSSRKATSVLAITSGKEGVGKTNVAANLAICLSASGK